MTKLANLAVALKEMDVENNLCSKVEGRRNWVIRIEKRKDRNIAYVGGYGVMRRAGFMNEYVKNIVKYKIRWFEYTYKKDFKKVIKLLEDSGFTIYNV